MLVLIFSLDSKFVSRPGLSFQGASSRKAVTLELGVKISLKWFKLNNNRDYVFSTDYVLLDNKFLLNWALIWYHRAVFVNTFDM